MSKIQLTYEEIKLLQCRAKQCEKLDTWYDIALEALEETTWLLKKTTEQYMELLHAVKQKCPGETRHDTALRFIRENQ